MKPRLQPIALTIAGFDPSSGAGITADLQVFAAHHLFGTSAITALTVQSTQGVLSIHPVESSILGQTLQHLTADLPPAGIKIGMLATAAIVKEVAAFLQSLSGKPFIVLDPVLSSTSGAPLLDPEGLAALHTHLLPALTLFPAWLTPNWKELSLLTNLPVTTPDETRPAADALAARYPTLTLITTAGDQLTPTDLLRLPDGAFHLIPGEHIESTSTHGTGCAFSSAILSNLIHHATSIDAVKDAKSYVKNAILHAPNLGKGHGPTSLLWPLNQ